MNPTIDFSKLSLQDALDLAILIEEEAKERYEEFVDQLKLHHTPQAASFFSFMAENETKHGEELSMRRQLLFQDAPSQVSRAMLWDVEAPDYDETRAFMSVRKAMDVAMACEVKAHGFFVAALEYIEDPEVRNLFEELRDEEVHHQELVARELAKLPPEIEIDTEGFEDEPVAQ
jgi:erythrin-vacuolar iron transport family protein